MQAQLLALDIAGINDNRPDNPVETIAYVTPQARNTATFLALACDKIVMHPDARLGDFERYVLEHPSLEGTIGRNLAGVAERKHRSPVLARGMLDRNMRILVGGRRGAANVSSSTRTRSTRTTRTARRKNRAPAGTTRS